MYCTYSIQQLALHSNQQHEPDTATHKTAQRQTDREEKPTSSVTVTRWSGNRENGIGVRLLWYLAFWVTSQSITVPRTDRRRWMNTLPYAQHCCRGASRSQTYFKFKFQSISSHPANQERSSWKSPGLRLTSPLIYSNPIVYSCHYL